MKQSNMLANISSIETMGLVDGPGIRVVFFLQGCHLRCIYCHNPETWSKSANNLMSTDEVIAKILRYKSYISKHGGVTFSGGEPLLQSEFLYQCCLELKKHNIHICIDTSGVGEGYEKLLNLIDLFIIDIKAIDPLEYKYITGRKICDFNHFMETIKNTKAKIWIRQVIVPNINDDKEHMLLLADYINKISNVEKVELLPYHTYGQNKYISLNLKYKLQDVPALSKEKEEYLNTVLKENLILH